MPSTDETELRDLIARWAKAVRDQNLAAIRADHTSEILMFDVPPPFSSRSLDEYMATWETFFRHADRPIVFDFTDVKITAGQDVAFATATGHCIYMDRNNEKTPLDFRLTMGFQKLSGKWQIAHEHHSVPAAD